MKPFAPLRNAEQRKEGGDGGEKSGCLAASASDRTDGSDFCRAVPPLPGSLPSTLPQRAIADTSCLRNSPPVSPSRTSVAICPPHRERDGLIRASVGGMGAEHCAPAGKKPSSLLSLPPTPSVLTISTLSSVFAAASSISSSSRKQFCSFIS